jgi:3-methyladenine DNA glycosylase AlkD
MQKVIAELKTITHGFKHVIEAGNDCLADHQPDHLKLATELLADDSYQVRMLATYLLGQLSVHTPKAMTLLETRVAKDESWQVQEMLAKAFDEYCRQTGYEKALPKIKYWLDSKHAFLVRAVIEGLRIWTGRPYFKDHPAIAIGLIAVHRADDSEYVRKSVGNALRDISKKYPDLVKKEIKGWNGEDPKTAFTYKLVVKNGLVL